jgi:serine/threonine protein kinase/Tol biopolymer transport system component
MALAPGERLGHYEVSEPLGAGGMGEVYRARDTRLDRQVAIKVLPEDLSEDPERLARFEREAKVLASLNHSNIATLFGIENETGPEGKPIGFLVMELVEGEDLAQRIERGPIPVGEATGIARQIADGLEAAHAQGIVHRDLKPGNIRITPDGTVKILDFGLAKQWSPGPGDTDFSESPTITADMTRAGTVLGTAPYLSPEQARGRVVDQRTDIWALGCVLFEMIAGERAFPGNSSTEVIARVLERQPDWTALPSHTPPALRRLLGHCLEKDPKRRLRNAGDFALALEDLDVEGLTPTAADDRRTTHPIAKLVPWLTAAAAVIIAIVSWLGRSASHPQEFAPVLRFTQSSPAALDIARIGHFGTAVAISPDGHVLAWVGATEEGTQLFMRHLDEDEVRPVEGGEGGLAPFFSPDSEWLGFFADGKLKKVSIRGGAPQTITEVEHLHGASWGDGIIVLEAIGDGVLFRVDPKGGEIEQIQISNRTATAWGYLGGYPTLLPGSDALLVTGLGLNTVDLVELDSGEVKNLVKEGTHGTYLSSGHLVWTQGDNLLAAPFDLSRREITGDAHTVVEGVVSEAHVGLTSHYAVSNTGTLAYLPGTVSTSGIHPVWVRPDGVTEPLNLPFENSLLTPRISPDGRRLLISRQTDSRSIWLYDLERGIVGPFTGNDGNQFWAIWSADGKSIVFNSQQGSDPVNLWMQPVDRSSPPTRLTNATVHHVPTGISPDGQTVFFVSRSATAGGRFDIHALHLGDELTIETLIATDHDECQPNLSPDGRWLAYVSDVSGRLEVYVKPYPSLEGTLRVSANGGAEPLWSPEGDRLYYRSENGHSVLAVDVLKTDPLSFGQETTLFRGNFTPVIKFGRQWDIHPDGDRFLMLEHASVDAVEGIRVVTNWFTELERFVPTNR